MKIMNNRNKGKRFILKELIPFFILGFLLILFQILNSNFLSFYNFNNLVRQSSILLILSMGQTFVILSGNIDLSIGNLVGFCGIITVLTVSYLGPLAIFVGPLVGLGIGYLQGLILVKGKIPSFLTTLGVSLILQGATLFITKGRIVQFNSVKFQSLASAQLFGSFPVLGIWSIGILIIAIFLAEYTRFGRYSYMIGGGEKVALLCGIPTNLYRIYIFMFIGLLGGLGGSLLAARMGCGYPNMGGNTLTFDTIIAVTLGGTAITGGVGGPLRSLLGVIIISILSNGLNVAGIESYLQIIVKGCTLVFAIYLTMDRSRISLVK